jgi:hypothetical protein
LWLHFNWNEAFSRSRACGLNIGLKRPTVRTAKRTLLDFEGTSGTFKDAVLSPTTPPELGNGAQTRAMPEESLSRL